jgi:hypothetical protein
MMSVELILGLGTVVGLGCFLWASQNILVGKKNQVEQVNASIDVILKKTL